MSSLIKMRLETVTYLINATREQIAWEYCKKVLGPVLRDTPAVVMIGIVAWVIAQLVSMLPVILR